MQKRLVYLARQLATGAGDLRKFPIMLKSSAKGMRKAMRYSREKIKEWTGVEIEDDFGFIEVVTERQFKSRQQSNTFHALLNCFWKSGCSSFPSYDKLRDYYKIVAHLCEMQFENHLDEESKQMIWKALKILPLKEEMRQEAIELLKGRILKWHSFSECSKEMAEVAITQLINDMFESRVDDSLMKNKFKEILDGFKRKYY